MTKVSSRSVELVTVVGPVFMHCLAIVYPSNIVKGRVNIQHLATKNFMSNIFFKKGSSGNNDGAKQSSIRRPKKLQVKEVLESR